MLEKPLRENLVISSLSSTVQQALAKDLSPVLLRQQTLMNPAGTEPDVVFPLTAVISIMTQTGDGQSVENAVVGYDGVFVLPPLANVRGVVQITGEALRMPRPAYQRHMGNEEFREAVDRYRDQ